MSKENIQRLIRKNTDILKTNVYGCIVLIIWALIKMAIFIFAFDMFSNGQVQAKFDPVLILVGVGIITSHDVLTIFTCIACSRGNKAFTNKILLKKILLMTIFIIALFFVSADIFVNIYIGQFDIIMVFSTMMDTLFLLMIFFLMNSYFKIVKLNRLEKEAE